MNFISALRRPDRAPEVRDWLRGQMEGDLFLSAITIGEIARGIDLQKAKNPAFAGDLSAWLHRTETLFADRILTVTAEDARLWGQLSARVGHSCVDLMIAAQALARDATVVTRNTPDFAPTGVEVFDPFTGSN